MNTKRKLFAMLLLILGAAVQLSAQTAVTVGNQVTDVNDIVSGKPYVLRLEGLTGAPYILDTGLDYYGLANNNTASQAAVYYLISDGNGGYKIENAFTGKYWKTPTSNGEYMAPADASNAGTWTIAASATANRFTFTCSVYHTNRSSSKLVAHTSDSPVSIFEVTGTVSTASTYTDFSGKDINVSSTAAANISEGQWYVMSQRSRTSYVFENTSDHKLKHTRTMPSGSAMDKAGFLVRLLKAADGKYYLQNGYGNYMGVITHNTNVPTSALGEEAVTIAKIANTDGHFYVQGTTNGVVLDANDFSAGDPATVAGWGTTAPTSTGGNNDWAFYPVDLVESWVPAITEVYTINNTNTNRGAMIYNPSGSTKYVWSSGKSGTFAPTEANSQWVIIPTSTAKQYYLYNVGAGKFAIPSSTAGSSSWIFSSNAVAITFILQSDGTYKIKTATTDTYAAVSNGFNGPIINYNDAGGNFTITKVDGDQSEAASAAVAKLVDNVTPLSAIPAAGTSDWYIIRIKTHGTYADKYVYPVDPEIDYNGTKYPLTFEHGMNVRPAIDETTYYTRIIRVDNLAYWQMPNGKYLYGDGTNSKFPVSTFTKSTFSIDYVNGKGITLKGANRYAVPYLLNSKYFIGETSSSSNAYYDVYPINLATAGLTAWQAICDNAPDNAQITCSRSDVSGLTAVYKNGYFFLPSDVTPEASDFALEGASEITVDATNKTISVAYDPNLALVEGSVTVEQGWQTAGRENEVMLLRVTASPFKAATNVSLKVNLKDGAEANISEMKLYEASTSSPEIYSTGDGAPVKTELSTATISGSTATFNIGNLSVGTHYYWIGATASSNATIGAILDAAVTDIVYTCNDNVTDLDLTNVGDPADRGAMVFNVHSYPFLPRDNGSRVYRIPAMIVAEDGSIVVAADKRYQSHTDIGNGGHVIDIVVRRSTDGGKTWSAPVTIAKGEGSTASGGDDKRCGFGDPSLVKGKDGKLYCLFAAGNEGYFYGQKGMCMSVSNDNGVTWSSGEGNPPVDLYWSGAIKNVATVGDAGYGLYDYFVTSGRGLYIPEDDILMYLIPAQTMTSSTEHTKNSSQDYIFYSTDGGESWYFSENVMFAGGDEAKIIRKNDGSLLGSVRQANNRGFNTATYTKNNDGTLSFTMGTQYNNSQLNAGGYANNQDIFYYQRETITGKKDIIFHSMTTAQHANFKLYYSTDGGVNWTEFLTVQTKGTRYVTMERSGSEENPGSLYLFFEDQSLNSAGGYTDYNHYPLNFLEITREQLESLIPGLNDYNIPEYLNTKVVKNTVYGTSTGCDSYGALTGTGSGHWARTWTSNATSGMAGLTVSTESGYGFDKATLLSTRVMTIKPSADGATDTYTITAPAGYVITGYTIGGAVYTGGTYRITAEDGTTTGDITSTTTPTNIEVNNVNATSTTFTFYGASQSNWFAVTNFSISLAKPLELNVVGSSSYATIYLPVDVTTSGSTKAYYIQTADNGSAQLTETANEGTEIPANTAVVLVNEDADATTFLHMTTGLDPVVDEDVNLLKGTLVPRTLDLSDNTTYYSLGKKNDKIGFYKFEKGGSSVITLGANKAYLDTPAASSARGFVFDYDDPTGINSIQDSEFIMQNGGTVYDLSGRRVETLKRGIYIVNGRKIIK